MKKISLVFILVFTTFSFISAQNSNIKYEAVISFHSFGEGIPSDKPLKDYVKNFKKPCKVKKIAADKIGPFGREGEYKLGFMLKEFNTKQKIKFIDGLQAVVAKMNDKGNAELTINETIDTGALGGRATSEKVVF